MAITIAQLANLGLNAAQQAALQNWITAWQTRNAEATPPAPIFTVDPSTIPLSQAKKIINFANDIHDLLGPALMAATTVVKASNDAAAKANDATIPGGSL